MTKCGVLLMVLFSIYHTVTGRPSHHLMTLSDCVTLVIKRYARAREMVQCREIRRCHKRARESGEELAVRQLLLFP